MFTKLSIAALAVAAGIGLAAGAARAETFDLKMSHFLAPTHGWQTDWYPAWAEEVNKRATNKIKIEVFAAGSAYGQAPRQYDQVSAGVIDVANGLRSLPTGRFNRTSIAELPFLFSSAEQATRTMMAMYPKYLAEDYKGVKVLVLHAHNPAILHTASKEVKTPDDIKGMRIRSPGPVIHEYLKVLGVDPVGMPPTDIYDALQKGVIGGVTTTWELLASAKLAEVTKYHLDGQFYVATFYFVMNQKKFDSLPEDLRKAIDEVSGEWLISSLGKWWDKWDDAGKAAARNGTTTVLDEAQLKPWHDAATPMIQAYLAKLEKDGVPNAREIYGEMQRLAVQYKRKG